MNLGWRASVAASFGWRDSFEAQSTERSVLWKWAASYRTREPFRKKEREEVWTVSSRSTPVPVIRDRRFRRFCDQLELAFA